MDNRNSSDVSSLTGGSKCLASAGGGWEEATVRTVNSDGTFKIEYDKPRLLSMPYYYGVTESEISVNDEARWPRVFSEVARAERTLSRSEFISVAEVLGHVGKEESLNKFWVEGCSYLFGTTADDAGSLKLDEPRAYRLIRQAGFSAKRIEEKLYPNSASPDFYKLYWNQTRMGGRNPNEIARAVTLDDAFAALGIDPDTHDSERLENAERLEATYGIALPAALRTFITKEDIDIAVTDSHPNSPSITSIRGNYDCIVRDDPRKHGLDGDIAVSVMLPHQGDHWWYAVFDTYDTDARFYVWREGEPGANEEWKLTAPTVGMFFWDLAQTGLGWFEDTQHNGGKPTIKTDIGLALRA